MAQTSKTMVARHPRQVDCFDKNYSRTTWNLTSWNRELSQVVPVIQPETDLEFPGVYQDMLQLEILGQDLNCIHSLSLMLTPPAMNCWGTKAENSWIPPFAKSYRFARMMY